MFSQRMSRVAASAIMELIKTTASGGYISFASGLPDPDLYPVETLREIADRVLREDGRAALQYGPAEGYPPLREFIAGMLRHRGLNASPEGILVTSGSQQALDLVARAFLDPGDVVLLENPSYLAAIQAFDSYGARYRTAPVDDAGMDLAALPPPGPSGVKLIYTMPNFQNPTGRTMSLERREALARAAAEAGIPLVEDDAYYDLRYEGEPLPPVCALAENPWAVYVGTFSKTIAPGLRVGYLCAAPPLAERLAQLKQIADLHTGSLAQRLAWRYCVEGHLGPGIERLRSAYRTRRDAMLEALEASAEGLLSWTRPAGGMFLFASLRNGRDAEALLARALERRVAFVPGASFHPRGGGNNTLRLNFVSAAEPEIRRGIRLLAEAIREWR